MTGQTTQYHYGTPSIITTTTVKTNKIYVDISNVVLNSNAENININDTITDISSTKLRNKIDKKMLPCKIYNYIVEKGIYNV